MFLLSTVGGLSMMYTGHFVHYALNDLIWLLWCPSNHQQEKPEESGKAEGEGILRIQIYRQKKDFLTVSSYPYVRVRARVMVYFST